HCELLRRPGSTTRTSPTTTAVATRTHPRSSEAKSKVNGPMSAQPLISRAAIADRSSRIDGPRRLFRFSLSVDPVSNVVSKSATMHLRASHDGVDVDGQNRSAGAVRAAVESVHQARSGGDVLARDVDVQVGGQLDLRVRQPGVDLDRF